MHVHRALRRAARARRPFDWRLPASAVLCAALAACGGGTPDAGTPSTAAAAAPDRKTVLAEAEARELTDAQVLLYIASYDDLIEAFGDDIDAGYAHYVRYAQDERRTISFDALRYIASYADLIQAIGANVAAGARHYIQYGHHEGRSRGTFDAIAYVASNPELIPTYGTDTFGAARHYIFEGFAKGWYTHGFDALRYIASYPDLITDLGADPAAATLHFVQDGYAKGRRPTFDGPAYLARYSDLSAAFGSDLQQAYRHFIVAGYRENRTDGTVPPINGGPTTPPPDPNVPTDPPPPQPDPDPPVPPLETVFIDPSLGWRVDDAGKVSRTMDGGTTWTQVGTLPATGAFRLSFGSANDGWAVLPGTQGTPRVFRTWNGGAAWSELEVPATPPSPHAYARLQALGTQGLLITNGTALDGVTTPKVEDQRQSLVTLDGRSWSVRQFDPVFVTRAGVMWSIADEALRSSSDGGRSVTSTVLAPGVRPLRVAFADERNGLVIGRTAAQPFVVWRTTDGGATWAQVAGAGLPASPGCGGTTQHRLTMSSATTARLGSPGPTCGFDLQTTDGGASWTAAR